MKSPYQTAHNPGFLFVHQSGAADNRGKAERRRVSSHVMRHYVARAKEGHQHRKNQAQNPVPQVIKFSLSRSPESTEQPDFRLPCVVATNSFDPFDSLATENQRNTISIIKSLFQTVQYDVTHFSWTDRYFDIASDNYWKTAMSDATTYHVVGTMQLIVRQDKDFYFHKVQAYRSLRQSVAHCSESQDETAKATLLSIASLLYLTGHETNLEESLHHVQAIEQLLTKRNNDSLSPTMWFTVMFGPLNFCTAFPFAYPTVPYYPHPACKWHQYIDYDESEIASTQASVVCSLLPCSIVMPTITNLFHRLFELAPLATQARHYEAIMGLCLHLKYDLCVCVAEVYWNLPKPPASMSAYHVPNASAPFTPSRPEVAFFQRVHAEINKLRFAHLEGEAARATYMLLIALHLSLWMLCSNRTRIQANAGAARLIDSIAEFASEPRCQALFTYHDQALLWVVVAGMTYSRYALREPCADLRLSMLARRLLQRCGIGDVDQMLRVMDLFAGRGAWCRDALELVFEDVGSIEASLNLE